MRATVRITGASLNTITALLEQAGEACTVYQDEAMKNLPCTELQLDEIWSFVGCKEGMKKKAEHKHPGDVWTWTALCPHTKVIPSFRVGDRSARTAFDFCHDLSGRFAGVLQITTDGHPAYRWAVQSNFDEVHFAQLIKLYGKDETGKDIVIGTRKAPVCGAPVTDRISTSLVERSNLTLRMGNRRFTRLTNAFSKKLANHCHMLAVSFFYYNFGRKHSTIKTAPAVAAGVANHIWTMEEMVEMIDTYFVDKMNAEFEKAFEAKYTALRTNPKSYTPIRKQAELPWYLDPTSGGEPTGL